MLGFAFVALPIIVLMGEAVEWNEVYERSDLYRLRYAGLQPFQSIQAASNATRVLTTSSISRTLVLSGRC